MNIEALAETEDGPAGNPMPLGGRAGRWRTKEGMGAARSALWSAQIPRRTARGAQTGRAIYRRSDPEIISPHGDVEFHFFSTHFSVT